MSCQINRNKETGKIEQVLAPNGQESGLYKAALLKVQSLTSQSKERLLNNKYIKRVKTIGAIKSFDDDELALAV